MKHCTHTRSINKVDGRSPLKLRCYLFMQARVYFHWCLYLQGRVFFCIEESVVHLPQCQNSLPWKRSSDGARVRLSETCKPTQHTDLFLRCVETACQPNLSERPTMARNTCLDHLSLAEIASTDT